MWPNCPVIQIICVVISNWRSALVDTSRGWTIPCDNFCLPLFRLSFPIFMLDNWSMPGSTKTWTIEYVVTHFYLSFIGFLVSKCLKIICSSYQFWHPTELLFGLLWVSSILLYYGLLQSICVCLWNKNIQMLVAPTLLCFIFHKVLLQILTVYLL